MPISSICVIRSLKASVDVEEAGVAGVVALDEEVAVAIEGDDGPLGSWDGSVCVAVHATGDGAQQPGNIIEVIGGELELHLIDGRVVIELLDVELVGGIQIQFLVTLRVGLEVVEEGLWQEDEGVAMIGRCDAGWPAVRVIVHGIDGAVRRQHGADERREAAGMVLVGADDAVTGAFDLSDKALGLLP